MDKRFEDTELYSYLLNHQSWAIANCGYMNMRVNLRDAQDFYTQYEEKWSQYNKEIEKSAQKLYWRIKKISKKEYKLGFSHGQDSLLYNGQLELITIEDARKMAIDHANNVIGVDTEFFAADDLHNDAYKIQPRIKRIMRERNKL